MIGPFQGEWRWLSNFWPASVVLEGVEFPSVEHAYVAAKSLDPEFRSRVLAEPKPGRVKRLGRGVVLRPDWDEVKLSIMADLVEQKFSRHEDLRLKLLASGEEEIVEVNSWGDRFWGVCDGVGENHLGRILMEVRNRARRREE